MTTTRTTRAVRSADGTTITYDLSGEGPVVVFVDGATCTRNHSNKPELTRLVAEHFAVVSYDRRGRGESTDTLPYEVAREIEDIEAVIADATEDAPDASASLFGHSSGACLALEATVALGPRVSALTIYDAPYNDDLQHQEVWSAYLADLDEALAQGRPGDAMALFMALVGTPAADIDGLRQSPMWPGFEAVAPTLAYDHREIMGDGTIPRDRVSAVGVPTTVMYGSLSMPFMKTTAIALSELIRGSALVELEGEGHGANPDVLGAAIVASFS